jgi:hypothetical protein
MSSKKKPRKHKNFKQEKLLKAEHKNNFFKRIKSICSVVEGGVELYNLLPEKQLDVIYISRFLPYEIIPMDNSEACSQAAKMLAKVYPSLMQRNSIIITPGGYTISLNEFLTIGISFFFYLDSLEPGEFKHSDEIRKLLDSFMPLDDMLSAASVARSRFLEVLGFLLSSLDKRLIWIKYVSKHGGSIKPGVQSRIEVYSYAPEKIHVIWDHYSRPATRVCWVSTSEGVKFVTVKLADLGIENYAGEMALNVYIQSHAIVRLSERIDCIDKQLLYYFLYLSLINVKSCKGTNDTILIEYRIFRNKVGYLVVDIYGGNLIIRTFLLVTQNGTPEGNKLSEIYNLGKLEKSYMGIDKLSTFMTKELEHYEKLRDILHKVDCDVLIDLYNGIKAICNKQASHTTIETLLKHFYQRSDDVYEPEKKSEPAGTAIQSNIEETALALCPINKKKFSELWGLTKH